MLTSSVPHFGLYWLLCKQRFGREQTVARLEALAALEHQALQGDLPRADLVRMHSVGVNAAEACAVGLG